MASRVRKAVSVMLGAMLVLASLAAMPNPPAQATSPSNESSCLFIDSSDALISAEYCTGNLVIPARVRTIKSRAFLLFSGSVTFEPNSQLETVERLAFQGGRSIRSIVFPPSVAQVAEFAIVDTGNTLIYIEGNVSAFHQNAIWQPSGNATFIQPRSSANRLTQTWTTLTDSLPFQIDCNTLVGDKDFIGVTYVALELHNCRPPSKPDAVNPPATAGFILNAGLNDSVTLSSLDGSHVGVVRMKALGQSTQRFAATALVSSGGFSVDAFGDEFDLPADNSLTCTPNSGSPLPTGVSLTGACRFEAGSGAVSNSSTTDVVIDWTSTPGVSNSVEIATTPATPVDLFSVSGQTSVRVGIQTPVSLSAVQSHQMNISTAQFSGTTSDWNRAIDSYAAVPSGQASALAAEPGLVADVAVDAFEAGQVSLASASSAVNAFASGLTADSSFLAELRSRISLQVAVSALVEFESSGLRSQSVRRQILALPTSVSKSALLARFTNAANSHLQQQVSVSAGIRTLVFSNPYLVEQFTVPAGVRQVTVELQGAEGSQGGDNRSGRPNRAGFKGSVSGVLDVTAGQMIYLGVGEAGGDVSEDCVPGRQTIAGDPLVAWGGTNPFGEYSGGDGGSPGVDSCIYSSDSGGGYGGAGGAASVVRVGSPTGSAISTTLVAGGSAGSGGSAFAGDRLAGATGLSSFAPRNDWPSTNGQSGQAFNYFAVRDELVGFYEPFITGSAGGGGGGATGGLRGDWAYSTFGGCPTISFCFAGSSPGSNATSGLSNVFASYVPYTFDSGMQANGRVTISYVVPSSPQQTTPTTNPGSSDGSNPTATPIPVVTTSDAPEDVQVVPFWKGAEVSWKAPTKDGGSPITGYEAIAATGQTCKTDKLSCRITGLSPGQLIEVSVVARNRIGLSKPATPSEPKVFAPLSLNLWQTKLVAKQPVVKLMNSVQLSRLRTMLEKDVGGFVLQVRVAKNGSSLSSAALKSLLAKEVRAVSGQLARANLRSKVLIKASVVTGNQKAQRPSVILISTKP